MAVNYFLYVRKSTDSEEKQILSIEAQLAELKILAEKENIRIKHIFQESMTAKEPGRPVFNEMITRMEKGEAQGIIAWHPDRLARNSVDGGRIIYLIDTNKIQFLKFPTFWFENTPQGKFMLNIAFGQSKYYVDNLSENVKRGLRQKVRRGEWPSGFVPPGYKTDRNLRQVVVDPIEGPKVKRLFETYATGRYTLAELRKVAASEWGLISRANKPWVKAQVQRTLKNTFYFGLMKFNGEYHQAIHAPLITKELHAQVQEVMVRKGKPHKYRKKYFPFIGIAKCAACGGSITAELQKGHHYYRCTKKSGPCPERYLREEELAKQISSALSNMSIPEPVYDFFKTEMESESEIFKKAYGQQSQALDLQIKDIETKLNRLLDAHLECLIEKAEYNKKKFELLQLKLEAEEQINKLLKQESDWLEPCHAFLLAALRAGQVAQSENLEDKRLHLKKIGSNFQIAARRLSFQMAAPWALLAEHRKLFFDFSLLEAASAATRPGSAGGNWENRGHLQDPSGLFEKLRKGRDLNPRYP